MTREIGLVKFTTKKVPKKGLTVLDVSGGRSGPKYPYVEHRSVSWDVSQIRRRQQQNFNHH